MKDFKVISDAEDSYHIQHKNGRKLTVDKKGLSPKAHDVIKKMCGGGAVKMSGGGTAHKSMQQEAAENKNNPNSIYYNPDPIPEKAPEATTTTAAPQKTAATPAPAKMDMTPPAPFTSNGPTGYSNVGYADGGEVEEDDEPEAPAQSQSDQIPAVGNAGPTNKNLTNQAPGTQTYEQALNQQIEATQAYQKTQQEAAGAQQKIYENLNEQINPTPDSSGKSIADMAPSELEKVSPQQIMAERTAQDAAYMEKLKGYFDPNNPNHFDPNRYFHQMGTGSRIMTGIALALGGAGAAQAGGPNIAYEKIKQAVNNDVEAQKSDYSNTMNMWKMNRENYNDILQANMATRNQQISLAQMMLGAQSNKVQNAKAQLDTQATLSQLQMDKQRNNMIMGVLSNRKPGAGGVLPSDADSVIRQTISDPNQQKQALESLQHNQSVEKSRQFLNQSFNDMADKAISAKLSPADREGALNSMALSLSNAAKMKPAAAKELLNGILPGGGLTGLESEGTVSKNRQRLNQALDNMKTDMWIYKPDMFAETSSNPMAHMDAKDLNDLQIANANPNHPESIRFHGRMVRKYGKEF